MVWEMRPIEYLSRITLALGLMIAPAALATPYDTLKSIAGTYNVFLLSNPGTASAPFQNTDAEGNGSVSGNVFVGDVAANLSSGVTIQGSPSLTGANQSLNGGSNGGDGPSAVHVTSLAPVNDPSYWTAARTSGAPGTPAAPLDVFGGSTDIVNAATSLTAPGGATTLNSPGGPIDVTLSRNGLNVIDLNIAAGAAITGINITNANGVTPTGLIINVNGDRLNFDGGSFNLGSLSGSEVLFNFGNATTVSLQNLGFEGARLTPLATVDFSSGHIDGALIVKNHVGSGQVNSVGFNDPLPTYAASGSSGTVVATSEPGSIALFATGVVVIGLFFRRRTMAGAALT
jgi:choice-of-anchor A domain-containing protein